MTNPVISVIIPVFNREIHLENCLKMLLSQTYKHLEIIVVDDGSTDSSLSIAKKYQVKIIEHKINKGPSVARNTGMDRATGEYIHFIDNDDQVNSTFYENLLSSSVSNNADISICSFINQKAFIESRLIFRRKIATTINNKFTLTYVGEYGYVWRYLFRADFLRINKLRFEVGRFVEDWPFSFQAVYHANKIVSVSNAEYIYVYNLNSILNEVNLEKQKKLDNDYLHANQLILDFAKNNGDFNIPKLKKGKFILFLRKIQIGFWLAIKYRNFKYLKL